jgi:Polyketide cyclase / dehydrase and lipid transport
VPVVASFTLHKSIAAPIEVVFDVLTDHRGMARISALRSSTLEREGDPPPNGVGAIRALRLVGPAIREQVTGFDRPTLFAYKLVSGLPARTYTGTVELAPQGTHTSLSYRVDTLPKLPMPAGAWAAIVRPGIGHLLNGIVKESERRARAGSQ